MDRTARRAYEDGQEPNVKTRSFDYKF